MTDLHDPHPHGPLSMRARGVIPGALLPPLVAARAWRRRSDAGSLAAAELQMRFLVEQMDAKADFHQLATGHLQWTVWRNVARWKPRLITSQQVLGLPEAIRARQAGRGLIVNFMHHGQFDGAFASLNRVSLPVDLATASWTLQSDAPEHLRVCCRFG